MSKSSFIVGLLVAAGLHVLLFVPLIQTDAVAPEQEKVQPVSPITMLDPPGQPKPKPKPKPQPVKQPQPKPQPKQQLAQQVTPPVPEKAEEELVGNTEPKRTPESIDDDALPPLRITWDSPAELRRVAGKLGMRIVGVNFQGQILGELTPTGGSELVEFHGQMSHYSNRVRTLPTGFFGPGLAGADQQVAELWILVPSHIDRTWMDLQKQAIVQTGLDVQQVRSIEGRFASVGGGYRLTVTRIVSSPGT